MINFLKSVLGNMPQFAEDLKGDLPSTVSKQKLEHFNDQWKYNKKMSKHAKHIDTQDALSNKTQKKMDTAFLESALEEGFPKGESHG